MSESTREAPTVFDHIAVLLDQMAGVAWQKLGLQPDMVTGQIEPNLEQARVAIDVVAFLAGKLESQLDEDDKRQVQSLVRDLKINFVQKGGA
ncbi:MAG: DUF1844 domain-containing protein [Armatimonadota bacterium]